MADVMIKCPKTGGDVPTGVTMDSSSFEAAEMSGNSFTCPDCGELHTWSKDDAWVR